MMAGRTRQAGSKDLIPARAVAWLTVAVVLFGAALALSDHFGLARDLGAMNPNMNPNMDPNVVWEVLIGGVVVCGFLASVALWIHSALRRVRRAQASKTAFVSSALNNLSHGVVMTDPQRRVVFCNDRYPRHLRPVARGYSEKHDGAGTAGVAALSAEGLTAAPMISMRRQQSLKGWSPACPTASRSW